jgi:hypothetical protein
MNVYSSGTVDFNSVRQDGTIALSRRRLQGFPPEVGEFLTLLDYEGHTCLAAVETIESDYLVLTPQWETWQQARDEVFSDLVFTGTQTQTSPSLTVLPTGVLQPVMTGR